MSSVRRAMLLVGFLLPVVAFARVPSELIIGGTESEDGAWPWQLSLRYLGTHSCGATLLGGRYAVTSAHCVGNAPISYLIVAGTNNRTCDDDNCVTRQPSDITRHPDYINSGGAGYPNDVAVVQWTLTLLPFMNVQIIPMALEDANFQDCYTTGWGRLTASGALPVMLNEAATDIISVAECQQMWSSSQVTDSQLCIMDKTNGATAPCNGDSGGPVVCQASWASPWELVGIVSYGRTGCLTTVATVSARVTTYRDWIQAQAP